jgi:hypothetical protein
MSYDLIKDLYDTITDDTNITNLVDSSNIKVGWQNTISTYPSIAIIRIGGNAVGRLGHNTSDYGQVEENFGVQIEIYSQNSLKEVYDICDLLTLNMITNGYSKLSDTDDWDDTLSAHAKITRWNKLSIYTKMNVR